MTTKLTLSIDKEVIAQSKRYAAAQNRSLSELIESYLRAITSEEGKNIKVTDKVSSLRGSFKVPDGFDYKKVLVDEISRKHG
jgi:Family of unknown function (DUF6364)